MGRWLINKLHELGHRLALFAGWVEPPQRWPLSSLGKGNIKMCANATKVVERLLEAGYQTYMVGGCVRDVIYDVEPKDFDIVSAATPEVIKKVFGRKARIIGRRFKIVHVVEGGDIIEVSTFRAHHSWLSTLWKSKKQNNNIYGTLIQDVWRRDFSCNALYYDVKTQEVIDYVSGVNAIQNKSIQVLGEPAQRIEDDPVRALRAVRFKAKTGFLIEKRLEDAIKLHGNYLERASSERLLVEVTKLFSFGHAAKAWMLLSEYKLLFVLFPGFKNIGQEKVQHYDRFITRALQNTDHRFHAGQKLSTSFLFAVLLWPVLQTKLQAYNKKIPRNVNLQQVMGQVFKEEAKIVAMPKRLQEAVMMIWQIQSDFRRKFKQAHSVVKNPRIKVAYDFLTTQAQIDESVVDLAIKWQPFVEKAQQIKNAGLKTTHE
ncbi:MAG: polynucleotide adenylyltransferase PcnB [Pseudomonadota bacterium]|nr:polynucleotide adenylyltransferase PcnB [Pseudomonadota bacterium]